MDELEMVVRDAFAHVDVDVMPPEMVHGEPDRGVDLVIEPDGAAVSLQIKRAAFVNDQVAHRFVVDGQRLLKQSMQTGTSSIVFVVADQVTRTARTELARANVGYLDLRGRLSLHAPGLIIEADVDPRERRAGRRDPLNGKAGRELAAALLMDPERKPAVRTLSRELNRSVSTVSEVLSAFRESRYIEGDAVSGQRLFWALADRWSADIEYLLEPPSPGQGPLVAPLGLGLDQVGDGPGWALRGTAAASALGAPVAVRADQPLDFYVPDATTVHRARRLLGTAPSADLARCTVAVAPVPAACTSRTEPPDNYFEWPTTHPLFVALDLAQDVGRGQEILGDWTPRDWPRVW
ncbi:transcriptional regulator [Kribbella speibonae]|uniref:Transcriptional regulator n=1 Tax=Kribbella speibonae TaxID=1572660 RepID=A0A4R0I901_9ACTN|nr:transcriptional regulator [Kribbella speibonae]TCC29443.1 transcriptional regulator [Kribbella speibonae]